LNSKNESMFSTNGSDWNNNRAIGISTKRKSIAI